MKKFLAIVLATVLPTVGYVEAKEIKVAAVEFAPQSPGGFDNNIQGVVDALTVAASNGAKLMLLPEAAMNGFAYADAQSLIPYTDTLPGKTTAAIERITRQFNAYVVVGLYEKDPVTGIINNAAALVGPKGYIGKYHKSTLAPGEGILATPGQSAFPVFDTDIGKIGLVICFDDSNIQNLLLPVLRGADIVVQPIGSGKLAAYLDIINTNHSTLANIATAVDWLGTPVISSNIIGVEGPGQGFGIFNGGSSVWDQNGHRLSSAPVSTWADHKPAQTIYATIDPAKQGSQKAYWLKHRRPELYRDVNSYRYPDDSTANNISHQISALLLQYESEPGNIDYNYQKIERLIRENSGVFNLTVLPFNSFLGEVALNKSNIDQYAEPLNGKSYQWASALAQKYNTYVLFSMPEKDGGKFHETAVLFDYNGKQVGLYRKSHLNDSEQTWATAGNDLPVFNIPDLGRVAIMMNDEVRIPEFATMYGIYRTDLVLVPAMYHQREYGGPVDIPKGVVSEASNRGMSLWYNIAKYAQAYTLVANYLERSTPEFGRSALYAQAPEIDYYPPNISPAKEVAYPVNFTTHTNKTLFMNQERLIASRRWDLSAPLALDMKSACFNEWQKNSTQKDLCPQTKNNR